MLSTTELIAPLPDTILTTAFYDEKYGSYYRNLQGTTEHSHYHLGQLVLVKKILRQEVPPLQSPTNEGIARYK